MINNIFKLKNFELSAKPLLELQYQIAQMYMVLKMQQQTTTSNEGVEVLESRSFQNDALGKGQYTSKVYRLQR